MQPDLSMLAAVLTESIAMLQQLVAETSSLQPLLDKLREGEEPLARLQALDTEFKRETAAYAQMLKARDRLISDL